MLSTPAPFPFVGSLAFLRPDADNPAPRACRILQRRSDGRISIAFTGREFSASNPDQRQRASGNRTVDLAELAETEAEAIVAPPARRKRARRGDSQ